MIIIHRASLLTDYINKQRGTGLTVGFVPTMGALHDAHIGLVNYSTSVSNITVCSIFVNPTQFNDPSDFAKYPLTIEQDIKKLSGANTTVLFAPPVEEVYQTGTANLEQYDLGYLETILEGRFRPGHFQGVCQVMSRLLKIVQPDRLIMGQKDYQQCMVIRRLLDILGMNTVLHTCETLREKDGLAMSSRNMRLTEEQRPKAALIFQTLASMKKQLEPGALGAIKQNATAMLTDAGFRVEYVEIADADTLHPLGEWNGNTSLVALVAAFLGEVRLIDNMLLNN